MTPSLNPAAHPPHILIGDVIRRTLGHDGGYRLYRAILADPHGARQALEDYVLDPRPALAGILKKTPLRQMEASEPSAYRRFVQGQKLLSTVEKLSVGDALAVAAFASRLTSLRAGEVDD